MGRPNLENIERHFSSSLDCTDCSKCRELFILLDRGYGVINPIKSIEVDGQIVDEVLETSFKEQQRLWDTLKNQVNRCLNGDISKLHLNVSKIMGNIDYDEAKDTSKFKVANVWQ